MRRKNALDIITPATDWTQDSHADEMYPPMSRAMKTAVIIGVFAPFISLLFAIVVFWNRGISLLDLILLLSMYSLTVIGITVGFHRLFTHRAFQTTRPVKLFLAIAGSMALQGPVIKWCAVHRRHHQVSDRDGDPHSPHTFGDGFLGMLKGMWHSHVGWIFENDPAGIGRSVTDLTADPILRFVDRTFFLWVAVGLVIPGAIAFAFTHTWTGALLGILWGGLVRLCLMHHATWSINSICHIWGTRPFHSNDESRNNVIFGIVSFGEGWHNNHHAFPTSARHGLRWYQLDISWLFIKTLSLFGLIWDIRLPSPAALKAKARIPAPQPPAPEQPSLVPPVLQASHEPA